MGQAFLSRDPLVNAPLTTGTQGAGDAGNYVFTNAQRRCLVTNQTANVHPFLAKSGADAAD